MAPKMVLNTGFLFTYNTNSHITRILRKPFLSYFHWKFSEKKVKKNINDDDRHKRSSISIDHDRHSLAM